MMTAAGMMRTTSTMADGQDEQIESVWQRARELREQGVDSAAAYRQAVQEHEVDAVVDNLDLDDDGEATGSCSTAQSVQWVADNLTNKSVQAADAPSPCAWGLLRWAQSSPVSRAEFYKNIWAKTLPTRQELDNAARYSDDGSTQIELAERILARIEGQRTEDERQRLLRKAEYERAGAGDRLG